MSDAPAVERQRMDADIVCVGFGPATAGFLTTLVRGMTGPDGAPRFESRVAPGMPLQVLCYERAEGLGFGVSGVVTSARAIRASFPDLDPSAIPMAASVGVEKLVYLLDPHGVSRRPALLKVKDAFLRGTRFGNPWYAEEAVEVPFLPPFLAKHGGLVMSLGAFLQWSGEQLMGSGQVQLWPGMPVASPLIEENKVVGVRLADQGVDKKGNPEAGYMPGMDIRADLTVVGDGPYGPVGRQLDAHFGTPGGHPPHEWALGMKFVVTLPEDTPLQTGTVLHTLGYPEPEIFGFLYVLPDRTASLGVFLQSWTKSPVRTAYRHLQHWMQHPYLWRYLKGATLRSWGAKSLNESGRRAEPHLALDGCARIGEGSGSTNVLTNSGVDEAWATGCRLAEGVLELLAAKQPFTRENLGKTYVARRRTGWLEEESRAAAKARDGFVHGFIPGLVGTGLRGLTGGLLGIPGTPRPPYRYVEPLASFFGKRIPPDEVARIQADCDAKGQPLHDALLDRWGWPAIPMDGTLLMSHQDVLLTGGKVQAPAGYADHVLFPYPDVCRACTEKICIEACSGQAIMPGDGGVPAFDREKCVHCGACLWNCARPRPGDPDRMCVEFRAGAGGLHAPEN